MLQREWGEVTGVLSGGSASDRPATQTDMRTSKEVYDRKITELCFTVQEYVKADQLKGLTEDAILQLCSREYEPIGGKMRVEKKEDLKLKLGRSCDDADAVCILCEIVRQRAGGPQGTLKPRHGDDWNAFVKKANEVYAEETLDVVRQETSNLPSWAQQFTAQSFSNDDQ